MWKTSSVPDVYQVLSISINSFSLPWFTLGQTPTWHYLLSQQEVGKNPMVGSVSCLKFRSVVSHVLCSLVLSTSLLPIGLEHLTCWLSKLQ